MTKIKYIHDIKLHNTQYDLACEKSQFAINAVSANWLVNNDDYSYHFSAENAVVSGDTIALYDTAATKVYNSKPAIITPKFDSSASVISCIELTNARIYNDTNNYATNKTVRYTLHDTQPNYSLYNGTLLATDTGNYSEYMGSENSLNYSTNFARIPFRFSAILKRKNDNNLTPDFDSGKAIATIDAIRGIDYNKLAVTGPTYIIGSCVIRPAYTDPNLSFPAYNSYRVTSRELFFVLDTVHGEIFLQTANCKFGNSKYSAYHCSYTHNECQQCPFIEVTFNTTLYIMFKAPTA